MTGHSSRPGGIVIGGDYQGLGVVRSLGRHGVPVIVVDDQPSVAQFSRYTSATMRVTSLRHPDATIPALNELSGRYDVNGWVLFPTRDEMVATISRNRDELSNVFRVGTPSWDAVRYAYDKRETHALAERLGVPTPRAWHPESADDLGDVDAFPVIIKPRVKDVFVRLTGAKAWRANSPSDLRSAYDRARRVVGDDGVVVQAEIPGGSDRLFGFCALFDGDRARGRMVTRYRRQHPPEFGLSCTCVETIASTVLDDPSGRLLRAMAYAGLVELEYKHDPRDGAYKLLDINARTWGYHALGAAAGVDFAYMHWATQVGLDVDDRDARPGVAWIRLLTDLPTSARAILGGRLSPGQWLRSVTSVQAEAVLARDDMRPTLAEIALLPRLIWTRVVQPRRVNRVYDG